MARTLPWLTNGASKKNDTKPSQPPPKRRKRPSSPEEDLVDSDLNDIATPPPRPKLKKHAADRTPSTSPVPAPLDVEYMRPGYEDDDIYIMVEDEFCDVAKQFTKHLHYGEYMRLKKLSKSRGQRTLSAIGHGVDGRTEQSRGLKLRMEGEAGERRRADLLGDGESSGEEDLYNQDPQLAGLMKKDRGIGVGRELAGLVKAKSNTRAAAGFAESPHTAKRYRDALDDEGNNKREKPAKSSSSAAAMIFEEISSEEDEDDLDASSVPAPPATRKPEFKQHAKINGVINHSSGRDRSETRDDSVFKRFAAPPQDRSSARRIENPAKPSPSDRYIKVEDDEDDTPRPQPARPTYKKAQKRQASQALQTQQNDTETKSSSHLSTTGNANGTSKRPSVSLPTAAARSPNKQHETSPSKNEAQVAATGYLARRAAERGRREKEQPGRGRKVDDIPTFLF